MCIIHENIKGKDLEKITGKSASQCGRDLTEIKKINNKPGRKTIVTHSDVSNFYKISEEYIIEKLKS